MHDAGTVILCSKQNIASRGETPRYALVEKARDYYEARTVGSTRFFAGRAANVRVDLLARVWRDETIMADDYAKIGNETYIIRQAQHTIDEDQIPVTDLSLERTAERFETQ